MITILLNYFVFKDKNYDSDIILMLCTITLIFDFMICWGLYNIIIKLIDKL